MWRLSLLWLLLGAARAELFTAMADVECLLGVEKEVTSVVENYIRAEEERLGELRK